METGSLPPGWRPLFTNANDASNEGLVHQHKPFFRCAAGLGLGGAVGWSWGCALPDALPVSSFTPSTAPAPRIWRVSLMSSWRWCGICGMDTATPGQVGVSVRDGWDHEPRAAGQGCAWGCPVPSVSHPPTVRERLQEWLTYTKAPVGDLDAARPRKVLILGSGGLSIGQAGEFDYSGSQVSAHPRAQGGVAQATGMAGPPTVTPLLPTRPSKH